jgi:hypothetical protein
MEEKIAGGTADDGGVDGKSHVAASKMDFHHPYTPYDIQEEFMSTVYQVLEEGKVGILESPTGTVSGFLSRYHVMFLHFHGLEILVPS